MFQRRFVVVRLSDLKIVERCWGRERAMNVASELNEDRMFRGKGSNYQAMHVSLYDAALRSM